jgi:hypothetical protein
MINLAGPNYERNNKAILEELERVGLSPSSYDVRPNQEVVTDFYAKWNGITFTRAWYYWVAHGPVSLDVAKALYATPVGKKDIRVGGHCGCIPPEGCYVTWLDRATNKKIIPTNNLKLSDCLGEDAEEFRKEYIFHDDPASLDAFGYIDNYHIDSELGLYLFVQAIKS